MAYFSGNFLHRTTIMLQCRLMIPWLKTNSVIIYCANGRGCSSSSIVKYIPRKAVKNKRNEGYPLPARSLEERRIGQFQISNELGRSFSDVDSDSDVERLPSVVNSVEGKINFMAVTDEIIEDPDKVVEENNKMCCGIPSGRHWQDVQNYAIELLASRAFTATELKKKLQGKNFQHETIDAVITDFKSRGLINDCFYAEAYARSRWSSSSWGPRRIRQALLKKGVSEADTEKSLKLVFKNNEGDEDEESGIGMSKVCMD